jgi:hypothetical protein
LCVFQRRDPFPVIAAKLELAASAAKERARRTRKISIFTGLGGP